MDDYTMQFFLYFSTRNRSILPDSVDADEQISGYLIVSWIIKGNDIGKRIMFQKLKIQFMKIFITTKNNINATGS